MGVQNIRFLHITGVSTGIRADQADALRTEIKEKINQLSKEEDIYKTLKVSINIGEIIKTQEEEISLHLKEQIQSLGGSDKCIVDITTTTKAASQLLLANCLINGYKNLYEFHLYKRVKSEFPNKTLYHNLESDDFRYIHLSDSPSLRRAYNQIDKRASLSIATIVVSILILLISVSWAVSTTVSIASVLASLASLATLVSLGIQILQIRRV
jgi:ribosome-associated translation inhibitor RaiA